jgi:alkylation response protein AidB-like acyl-CoA dehydrogenase
MNTLQEKMIDFDLTFELGKKFQERAADYDQQGAFVEENYRDLQFHGYFIALIPEELGGLGISHSTFCDHIRIIGQHCGSTALSLSMHSHLVSANLWKYKRGMGGDDVLKRVVDKELILISTGARDWLESNGEMVKVENGYLVSGMKFFASQSAFGHVAVTSAPYYDPKEGWQVLHFGVPLSSKGVTILNDWDTMGMRGTGSNTIKLDQVFVPESAIALTRPQGEFHPFWNVVLTVAMPLIMSAYVGIAQKAYEIAVSKAKKNPKPKAHLPYQLGELYNEITLSETLWKDMVRIANDLDFEPVDENSNSILARKTMVSKSVMEVVNKAIGIVGGSSFYKKSPLEKIARDIQASKFHPLQEKDQYLLVGERMMMQ